MKLNRRKGQAINLDWMVGLSLFMVAMISATVVLVDDNSDSQQELRKKAQEVSQNIKDGTQIGVRKNPLYIRGSHDIGKIPIDTDYAFTADVESAVMDIPSEINESGDSLVTVVKTGNRSHELTYFFEEIDKPSYSNDIETGDWMNNSKISVLPSSSGLDALRINDKEMLSSSADFQSGSTSIEEHELYAEAGRLKIYNNSKELILENPNATFNLKNFTDLYWGADGNTYDLNGTGTIQSGETPGFTVSTHQGDDHGITFTGDLDVEVSKPDNTTVEAEVNASRVRITLHDTDYNKGQKRIEFHEKGDIYFGAERKLSGIYPSKTNSLNRMADIGFENRFGLRDFSYNITFLDVERGFLLPYDNVVSHNRRAAVIDSQGNFSTTDIKVRIWR